MCLRQHRFHRVVGGVLHVRKHVRVGVEGDSYREAWPRVTNPGFSEEFEAEEAVIVRATVGGAVQVGVDGENSKPLGPSGEPARRTFTSEPES